ncbi:MAG: hypothetical protein JWO52_4038 [Gammaproteobacteria bacterium]|nr:hypothetical protein [Gammaproteobacteria bacterium]
MRLTTRIHEWLAQHVRWIPYPDIRPRYNQRTFNPLAWKNLSNKQRGWVFFAIFWGGLIMLSLIGNLFF